MHFLSIYACLLAHLTHAIVAFQLDVHGERISRKLVHHRSRRTPGLSQLNNAEDISYYAEVNVGGNNYTLLVDTGSSDIWIADDVSNSINTTFNSGVNYAHGSVTGVIKMAEVQLAGYTIPQQAFLQVTPDNVNTPGTGILGLGPNEASKIYNSMKSVEGATLLERIFLQNLTTPNYLTVLLGRTGDFTDYYGGSLTIGQVVPGYEAVLKQPKLAVVNSINADLHFQVLLDENGLIGPDGMSIPIRTSVPSTANAEQLTVVIDTGFSLPQVPSSVSAKIYGRFPGAQLVDIPTIGNTWLLPCSQEVNITFKFNGQPYPIHPLDATLDPTIIGMPAVLNSAGKHLCIGTFQPFTYDIGAKPSYDMILGMSFLRNVYALMDYGDFTVDSDHKDDPYVQFLSITNATKAHEEFVAIRLNGTDTTGDQILNPHGVQPTVFYIAITVSLVVLMIGIALFYICYVRIRNRKTKESVDKLLAAQRS